MAKGFVLVLFFWGVSRRFQSDNQTDLELIGFYLISVKPMNSSWRSSQETICGSLVLESHGILVSELDGI